MTTLLPVDKMTKLQKIRAMNELWTSLIAGNDHFKSPAWHLKELEKRVAKAEAGQAVWTDWSIAKERIRKVAHANKAK